jgi:hypothetical protein
MRFGSIPRSHATLSLASSGLIVLDLFSLRALGRLQLFRATGCGSVAVVVVLYSFAEEREAGRGKARIFFLSLSWGTDWIGSRLSHSP